jgi:hypothetical protein
MSGTRTGAGVLSNGIKAIFQISFVDTNLDFTVPISGVYEIAVQGACGGAESSPGSRGGIVVHRCRLKRDQVVPCLLGRGGWGSSNSAGLTSVTLSDVTLLATAGANNAGAVGVGIGGNVYNGDGNNAEWGPYLNGSAGNDTYRQAQAPNGTSYPQGLSNAGYGGAGRIIFTKIAD